MVYRSGMSIKEREPDWPSAPQRSSLSQQALPTQPTVFRDDVFRPSLGQGAFVPARGGRISRSFVRTASTTC